MAENDPLDNTIDVNLQFTEGQHMDAFVRALQGTEEELKGNLSQLKDLAATFKDVSDALVGVSKSLDVTARNLQGAAQGVATNQAQSGETSSSTSRPLAPEGPTEEHTSYSSAEEGEQERPREQYHVPRNRTASVFNELASTAKNDLGVVPMINAARRGRYGAQQVERVRAGEESTPEGVPYGNIPEVQPQRSAASAVTGLFREGVDAIKGTISPQDPAGPEGPEESHGPTGGAANSLFMASQTLYQHRMMNQLKGDEETQRTYTGSEMGFDVTGGDVAGGRVPMMNEASQAMLRNQVDRRQLSLATPGVNKQQADTIYNSAMERGYKMPTVTGKMPESSQDYLNAMGTMMKTSPAMASDPRVQDAADKANRTGTQSLEEFTQSMSRASGVIKQTSISHEQYMTDLVALKQHFQASGGSDRGAEAFQESWVGSTGMSSQVAMGIQASPMYTARASQQGFLPHEQAAMGPSQMKATTMDTIYGTADMLGKSKDKYRTVDGERIKSADGEELTAAKVHMLHPDVPRENIEEMLKNRSKIELNNSKGGIDDLQSAIAGKMMGASKDDRESTAKARLGGYKKGDGATIGDITHKLSKENGGYLSKKEIESINDIEGDTAKGTLNAKMKKVDELQAKHLPKGRQGNTGQQIDLTKAAKKFFKLTGVPVGNAGIIKDLSNLGAGLANDAFGGPGSPISFDPGALLEGNNG